MTEEICNTEVEATWMAASMIHYLGHVGRFVLDNHLPALTVLLGKQF